MTSGLEIIFRGKPDDDTAAVIAQILGIVTSISERIDIMAGEYDDLKREVAETKDLAVQVLDVATQAVNAINDLRSQLTGGISAEEAAALASTLDGVQVDISAKLAALSDAINPNTQVTTGAGDVQPA